MVKTIRHILALLAVALMMFAGPVNADASSSTTASTAPVSKMDQVIVSGFSEKGDGIDNGVSSVYVDHWVKVTATTSSIFLSYDNPSSKSFATFSFAPVAGQSLAVGNYINVQRAAYRSAGFPGLEITGPGRPSGCTRLMGSFRIWDIAADASGTISRLDLTYVEHCGDGRPSNFGEVLINDAPQLGVLFASAVRITFPDQTPTLPYELTNPTSQPQPISLWQSATTVSHFMITPAKPSCAVSVRAKSTCTYLIRLVPPKPGNYVATVLAASGTSTLHLSLSGPAGGA
ncbi:MAG TPA: hypothetical protein VIJ86_07985 [Acidimicrobiales bacterium]